MGKDKPNKDSKKESRLKKKQEKIQAKTLRKSLKGSNADDFVISGKFWECICLASPFLQQGPTDFNHIGHLGNDLEVDKMINQITQMTGIDPTETLNKMRKVLYSADV